MILPKIMINILYLIGKNYKIKLVSVKQIFVMLEFDEFQWTNNILIKMKIYFDMTSISVIIKIYIYKLIFLIKKRVICIYKTFSHV